jgi:hypothetical protein
MQSVSGKIFLCDDSPRARFALRRANGRSIALVGDTTVVARMLGLEVTLSGQLVSSGRRRWPRLDVKRAIVHGRERRQAWDGILGDPGGGGIVNPPANSP